MIVRHRERNLQMGLMFTFQHLAREEQRTSEEERRDTLLFLYF
jgi:hypothetical protein